MERMDAAGAIVNANIILHARAARSVISSLNATGAAVDDFHAPLGIETGRDALSTRLWREALRDPQQLKKAGAEAAQQVAMAGGTAAALAVAAAGAKNIPKKGA